MSLPFGVVVFMTGILVAASVSDNSRLVLALIRRERSLPLFGLNSMLTARNRWPLSTRLVSARNWNLRRAILGLSARFHAAISLTGEVLCSPPFGAR